MDTFMDRLTQRLTAQEMIRANTAADTEEMNKLKAQVAEYNQCLEQLRKLLDEEIQKLKNTQVNGENINRLTEEAIAKIRAIQQDSTGSREIQKQLSEQLNSLERQTGNTLGVLGKQTDERLGSLQKMTEEKLGVLEGQIGEKLNELESRIAEQLDTLEKQLGALEQLANDPAGNLEKQVSEKLGSLEKQVGETLGQTDKQLAEKFTTLEENVHKECVKVYRNVQAVVVEESSKQSETVSGSVSGVKKMGGKVGAILGISVGALLVSLGSLILQIMQMAH